MHLVKFIKKIKWESINKSKYISRGITEFLKKSILFTRCQKEWAILKTMKIKNKIFNCKSEVTQLCLTLCNPMGYSLPGSCVHGIFQTRILEWVAISFTRGSSWLRIGPVSLAFPTLAGGFFTTMPPGKPLVPLFLSYQGRNPGRSVRRLCLKASKPRNRCTPPI